MAKIPTKKDLKEFEKLLKNEQKKQKRTLQVDSDGHGPGVLPEEIAKDYNADKAKKDKKGFAAAFKGAQSAVKKLLSQPTKIDLRTIGTYDTQNIKPKTHLIWHHSVGPESDEHRKWSDRQWKDWYNAVGRTRTYAGYSNSFHYEADGRETFSAVPIVLVPNGDGDSINTDTWRIIEVSDWENQIFWHAGNWEINRRAVGCETYGRWDNKELPENAVRALARWAYDNIEARNGRTTIIWGHKEVNGAATACPGTILPAKRDLLVDMTNNPQNYNNLNQKKWQPAPPPQPDYVVNRRQVDLVKLVNKDDVSVIDFTTGQSAKTVARGTTWDILGETVFNGNGYWITKSSIETSAHRGMLKSAFVTEQQWADMNKPVEPEKPVEDQQVTELKKKVADLTLENTQLRGEVQQANTDKTNAIKAANDAHNAELMRVSEGYRENLEAKNSEIQSLNDKIKQLEMENEELRKGLLAQIAGYLADFGAWFMQNWTKLPVWLQKPLEFALTLGLFYLAYTPSDTQLFTVGKYGVSAGIVVTIFKMMGYSFEKKELKKAVQRGEISTDEAKRRLKLYR